MRISQLIERLERIQEDKGDIPVCIKDASENYGFPYLELATATPILNEEVYHEDSDETEILNFIALDYK